MAKKSKRVGGKKPKPVVQAPVPMGPADGSPQALPTEEVLNVPASTETEEEKLERLNREAEINKVAPEPVTNRGEDTVGVGQPSAQPVNQGQSLPAAAIPVERKFETGPFHDPMQAERGAAEKDQENRGEKKTDSE